MLRYLQGWRPPRRPLLGLLSCLTACGDPDPGGTGQPATGPGITSVSSFAPDTTSGTSTGDPADTSGTGNAQTTSSTSTTTEATTDTGDTTGTTGSEATTITTDGPPEYVMFADPLIDGTLGTAVGGSFGPAGWRVLDKGDRVYWQIPRIVEGSVTFTVASVLLDTLPLNDHEIFTMYEGGHDIEHPIAYNPEFRNNAFKTTLRILGKAEGDRFGQQELLWSLCPVGAPGYHDGTCPCGYPPQFADEAAGGPANWDGSPQRLKVEWADGVTRYYRNDIEIVSLDWSAHGLGFGPESLYISLGNPRQIDVDKAGMPIGAVFSNLVVEGWTGPAMPACPQ